MSGSFDLKIARCASRQLQPRQPMRDVEEARRFIVCKNAWRVPSLWRCCRIPDPANQTSSSRLVVGDLCAWEALNVTCWLVLTCSPHSNLPALVKLWCCHCNMPHSGDA